MKLEEIRVNGQKNEQTAIYSEGSNQVVATVYEFGDAYRYSVVRYTGENRIEESGYADSMQEAEDAVESIDV